MVEDLADCCGGDVSVRASGAEEVGGDLVGEVVEFAVVGGEGVGSVEVGEEGWRFATAVPVFPQPGALMPDEDVGVDLEGVAEGGDEVRAQALEEDELAEGGR